MKIKNFKQRFRNSRLRLSVPHAFVAVVFAVAGSYLVIQSQAAAARIYITPTSTNKYVGDTFNVQVRINTTSPINAAFVDIHYNAIGMKVTNVQRGSHFPNENSPTKYVSHSTGRITIKMQSTRSSSITGNLHFATLTIKSTKTGTYGITPLSSSHLFNYPSNEVSYTYDRADYSFTNKPAPAPAPAPSPSPAPTPTPAPAPAPAPAPSSSGANNTSNAPTTNIPMTESEPSSSNLKISDFGITDIGYRKAVVTWKTNKPATSKVNYGFDEFDMPFEVANKKKVKNHKLVLQGDPLRAGNLYAVRVTSNDGNGPVTLDGGFTTKAIIVSVTVTDETGQPVPDATVSSSAGESITDAEGLALIAVPEGSVVLSATNGEYTVEQTIDVAIPESEDAPLQEFGITLDPASAVSTSGSSISPWLLGLLLVVGAAGIVAAILLFRRRRSAAAYKPPEPKVTVKTDYGSQNVHHATLPELISQDIAKKSTTGASSSKEEEPEDMFSELDNPTQKQKAANHVTTHAAKPHNAKPHESKPQSAPPAQPNKSAPVHKKHEPEKPKQSHEKAKPHHKDSEIDPKDNSLRIIHDD